MPPEPAAHGSGDAPHRGGEWGGMGDMETIEDTPVVTPRGAYARILSRAGTSDLSVAGGSFYLWGALDDEYQLVDLRVSGVFVDVGAHIGTVTASVLLDNPTARAICVEPVAENVEMLRRNMEVNGLTHRARIVHAAVGPGEDAAITFDYQGEEYIRTNRYVAGIARFATTGRTVTVPTVSLASLLEIAGGEIDAMKLDCEGCEWHLLTEPDIGRVGTIFGEWHGHPIAGDGYAAIVDLLAETHDVESRRHLGGTGTFWAVRR